MNSGLLTEHKAKFGAEGGETRCVNSLNTTVPVLAFPLSELIKRLRLEVEHVKIDAQGWVGGWGLCV